jgi:hypothetical protein
VSWDRETCVVTPSGGIPLAFDLGDVDRTVPGEWDLQLALYTGRTLTLRQFGAAFNDMTRELIGAWRDRTVECLLLEDLEEAGRYTGTVNGGPVEIRIFRSNLAVLPQAELPFQWRLAEVDSIRFDDASYSIVLTSRGERLALSKFAKKTDEVFGKLRDAIDALRRHSAEALHAEFPFLNADALVRLQTAMPEGRSASLDALAGLHPKLPDALVARAVGERLRPYFNALRSRALKDPLMAGFKFIRPDEVEEDKDAAVESGDSADSADGTEGEERQPLFFWFFFPLPKNVVAWEATTGTGRATYFFRSTPPVAAAIASLTCGLALVNFRREPVYLPDDSLEQQPRFHRYAIGARKLADLRSLRAAYLGRAIHSTPEQWNAQVDGILAGA